MNAHDLGAGWFASFDEEHPGSLTLRNPDKGQRINLSNSETARLREILAADDDDGCPKDDPDCMGNNSDCHDACERPPA